MRRPAGSTPLLLCGQAMSGYALPASCAVEVILLLAHFIMYCTAMVLQKCTVRQDRQSGKLALEMLTTWRPVLIAPKGSGRCPWVHSSSVMSSRAAAARRGDTAALATSRLPCCTAMSPDDLLQTCRQGLCQEETGAVPRIAMEPTASRVT